MTGLMWWVTFGASILVVTAGLAVGFASFLGLMYINDPKVHSGWEFGQRVLICVLGLLAAASVMWAAVLLISLLGVQS